MIDENVKAMYMGYFSAFDAMPAKDPELQRKINDWKNRVETFAATISNILDFYPKYMESGLNEEYTTLVSQLYMQDNASATHATVDTDSAAVETKTPIISVRNFLEQYRTAYDEIRKANYRKRTEKAYENIFAVADRTDNMIEAQTILEQERLLWKIISEDCRDVFEPILEATDPLYEPIYLATKFNYELYLHCECDEEMTYRGQRAPRQINLLIQPPLTRILFATTIVLLAMKAEEYRYKFWTLYQKGAMDNARKNAATALVIRDKCRRMLQLLKESFDLTFDDLVADKHLRHLMLAPFTPLVTLGRYRKTLPPAQLEFYSEIINEQILPDLTDEEFLLHETRAILYKNYESPDYDEKIKRIAKENSMNLTYYKYEDALDKQSKSDFFDLKEQKNKKTPNLDKF